MYTSCFKALDGDYKIGDIKVEGANGMGGDTAQLVETDGSWGQMYYYLTDDGSFVPDGWYKDMFGGEPVTDADLLTTGQSLFLTMDSDTTMTVAGQVLKGQPTVDAAAGFSMVGNPIPVTVKFSEITVTGANGMGGDTAQRVLADGSWGQMYYYLTDDGSFVPDGWYKDMFGGEPVTNEDTLGPGEGVFVTTDADITITFPAAL